MPPEYRTFTFDTFPDRDTLRLYYGSAIDYALPQRFLIGDSLGKTFTNTVGGSSVVVGDNGFNPYLTINSAYPTTKGVGDMVLPEKDVPAFAHEVFKSTRALPKVIRIADTDGRESFKAGSSDEKALVYAPESDTMAQRNLNFALANLAAYVDWKNGDGKKRIDERKAETERKAKAQEEEKRWEGKALRAYNAYNGVSYSTFPDTYHGRVARDRWIRTVKEMESPKLVDGSIANFKINPAVISGSLSSLLTERTLNARTIPGSGYTLRGF